MGGPLRSAACANDQLDVEHEHASVLQPMAGAVGVGERPGNPEAGFLALDINCTPSVQPLITPFKGKEIGAGPSCRTFFRRSSSRCRTVTSLVAVGCALPLPGVRTL